MLTLFKSKLTTKERSERTLLKHGIPLNTDLPSIDSENETDIRSPKEIGQRLTVLALTNAVAFNAKSGKDGIIWLKENNLWSVTSPKEKDFLEDPSEAKKNHETWKCECIWVLLWALKKNKSLGFPNKMCDLSQIKPADYPLNGSVDVIRYLNNIQKSRTKTEILDATDLYYRLNQACQDAKQRDLQPYKLNSGTVYERSYTLNWLIKYMDQDWDDVNNYS